MFSSKKDYNASKTAFSGAKLPIKNYLKKAHTRRSEIIIKYNEFQIERAKELYI